MSDAELEMSPLLLVGGHLCLDFCNTLEYRDSAQPIDLLAKGYKALVRWCYYANILNRDQAIALMVLNADSAQNHAMLTDAIMLRETLYRLFKTRIDKTTPAQDDLGAVNTAIQRALREREIATGADGKLGWRWRDTHAPNFMLHPIALSAEALLTADAESLARLRQCPGCGWLFFDESRNRSRTWCDMRFCGNRAKAKRFHQRQKADDHEGHPHN